MTAGDLKQGIRHIQNTVNGSVSAYSLDDRIANYGGSVKSLFSGFSGLSSKAGRIILAALLVTCLAVGYLFFTMDFENTLFKSIERDFSYVQKQKITIAEKTNEYKEIRKKLEKLDQKDLTREDKIKLLSLAVEEAKIRDIIEQTKLSAKEKEKQIADKNKRLKKVREETFLRRLFRR